MMCYFSWQVTLWCNPLSVMAENSQCSREIAGTAIRWPWGHGNLDLWALTTKILAAQPWVQVTVGTKCEEFTSFVFDNQKTWCLLFSICGLVVFCSDIRGQSSTEFINIFICLVSDTYELLCLQYVEPQLILFTAYWWDWTNYNCHHYWSTRTRSESWLDSQDRRNMQYMRKAVSFWTPGSQSPLTINWTVNCFLPLKPLCLWKKNVHNHLESLLSY